MSIRPLGLVCVTLACEQMKKRILQLVTDSFGTQFYGKAMDCLKALREQCIKVKLNVNDTLSHLRNFTTFTYPYKCTSEKSIFWWRFRFKVCNI